MQSPQEAVKVIGDSLHSCDLLREKIKTVLNQDAPVAVAKGNAIASGVHAELDELRAISTSGKEFLEGIEKRESQATGISSLKISFNNVFGYYIEVRNMHKDKVIIAGDFNQVLDVESDCKRLDNITLENSTVEANLKKAKSFKEVVDNCELSYEKGVDLYTFKKNTSKVHYLKRIDWIFYSNFFKNENNSFSTFIPGFSTDHLAVKQVFSLPSRQEIAPPKENKPFSIPEQYYNDPAFISKLKSKLKEMKSKMGSNQDKLRFMIEGAIETAAEHKKEKRNEKKKLKKELSQKTNSVNAKINSNNPSDPESSYDNDCDNEMKTILEEFDNVFYENPSLPTISTD